MLPVARRRGGGWRPRTHRAGRWTGRHFRHGGDPRRAVRDGRCGCRRQCRRRRGAGAHRRGRRLPDRHRRGDRRAVFALRRRDRPPHRRRTRRLVVRLRLRRPPQGVRPYPRGHGGRHAVVAGRRGRVVGDAVRAGLGLAGSARPPGRARVVERCARLRRLGRQAAAERGRMGEGGARRTGADAVSLGRRAGARRKTHVQCLAGTVPGRQYRRRRLSDDRAGARLRAQRVRAPQRRRQCLGMVRRRLERRLARRRPAGDAHRSEGAGERRRQGDPRRLVSVPRLGTATATGWRRAPSTRRIPAPGTWGSAARPTCRRADVR